MLWQRREVTKAGGVNEYVIQCRCRALKSVCACDCVYAGRGKFLAHVLVIWRGVC